jgi:hypothetical protein
MMRLFGCDLGGWIVPTVRGDERISHYRAPRVAFMSANSMIVLAIASRQDSLQNLSLRRRSIYQRVGVLRQRSHHVHLSAFL